MKKLFLISLIIAFVVGVFYVPASFSQDWYLASDIPTGIETGSEIRVDGGEWIKGIFAVSDDNQSLLHLNLSQYNNGQYLDGQPHIFEGRYTCENCLPGGISDPFAPPVAGAFVMKLIKQ